MPVAEKSEKDSKILTMIAPVAIEGLNAGVDTEDNGRFADEHDICVTPVTVKQEVVSVKRKLPVSEDTELLEVEQKRLKIDESRLLVEQK